MMSPVPIPSCSPPSPTPPSLPPSACRPSPAQVSGDDAALRAYIARNATDAHLQSFFTSKLQLLSPCEDCFEQLAHGVPGFVCCQFVDLADPGEVLLEHWEGGAGEQAGPQGGASEEALDGRARGEDGSHKWSNQRGVSVIAQGL